MDELDVINALAGLASYRSIDDDDLPHVTMTTESKEVPSPIPGQKYFDIQAEKRVECVRIERTSEDDMQSVPQSFFIIDEFNPDRSEPFQISPAIWVRWRMCLLPLD